MALRRVPAPDLFRVTIRQPLQDFPPKGFCYISFRAGQLHRREGKLAADKRKGQVAIIRNDQGCTELHWYTRIFAEGSGPEEFTLADEPEVEEPLLEFGATFEWFRKDRRILKLVFKDVRPSCLSNFYCSILERELLSLLLTGGYARSS
jgi:hypothetical protein